MIFPFNDKVGSRTSHELELFPDKPLNMKLATIWSVLCLLYKLAVVFLVGLRKTLCAGEISVSSAVKRISALSGWDRNIMCDLEFLCYNLCWASGQSYGIDLKTARSLLFGVLQTGHALQTLGSSQPHSWERGFSARWWWNPATICLQILYI